jgi:hypothetical protein
MGKTTADASLAPASAASSSSAASTGSRSPPRPAQPPSGSQGANPSNVAASGTERGGSASTGSKGKGKAQAADAERPTVKPDVGVTGPAAADDGAQDGPRPKKRRRRAALNCQECRRLKVRQASVSRRGLALELTLARPSSEPTAQVLARRSVGRVTWEGCCRADEQG